MLLVLIAVLAVIVFHARSTYSKGISASHAEKADFLKPDIKAFLFYRFISSFLATAVFFVVLFAGLGLAVMLINRGMPGAQPIGGIPVDYLWAFLSFAAGISYLSLSVQYKKEKYFFYKDRFIRKGGGIFSDFEKELNVKNITHVTMQLPFIENKLFGAGNIKIESAGALATEIFLRAIDRPEERYENVINVMKDSGFRLKRDNLIEQERPHPLAVFFEVFGVFSGAVFFVAYLFIAIMDETKIDAGKLVSEYGALLGGGVGLIFLGILTFCIFHFLDLQKRVYELYEDTITYTEGFLNKNYSFIPIENLADSAVTQSFFSRLFGPL